MRYAFNRKSIITILIVFCTLILSSSAWAAYMKFAWDPNAEEDLAGYVVYYGTTSGRYLHAIDIGNTTTCTLAGLTPGVTYYIALTAYDTLDNESDLSDEVSGLGRLVPPYMISFQINSGATNTGGREVTLNSTAANGPTHYMASESSSFSGGRWLAYSEAARFKLSAGAGTKTVYFKTKNIDDESSVVSDAIFLEGPSVASFGINSGASNTGIRTVTLNNTAINSPTHYMANESSDFSGGRWLRYSEAAKFKLSAGAGTKTVYYKVKNINGESPVVGDAIFLEGPSVASFGINSGASNTGISTVTLNNTAINSPTHYMASESLDFSGGRWLRYSEAAKFKLNAGAGTKTVYFKVKNAVDESAVVGDTITAEGPTVTTFDINNGGLSTATKTVTLDNTALNGPTHYMASESSSFDRARWTFYSVKPRFTLSVGAGTKTVYFKVKNSVEESPVVSDSITLE
jgi:phage baseplate assembly protein gpV